MRGYVKHFEGAVLVAHISLLEEDGPREERGQAEVTDVELLDPDRLDQAVREHDREDEPHGRHVQLLRDVDQCAEAELQHHADRDHRFEDPRPAEIVRWLYDDAVLAVADADFLGQVAILIGIRLALVVKIVQGYEIGIHRL